jgi:hypothetical protein
MVLLVPLREIIADLLNRFWIIPVMSDMYEGALWYFIATSLIFTGYYLFCYQYERYVSKLRIWVLAVTIILYILCLVYSKVEIVKGWHFSIYSALIFIIPLTGELLLLTKRHKIKYDKDDNCPLIYEKPIKSKEEDSYNRYNYSRIVAQKVSNNFHKEGSYVIGISGSWGSGKTSFLNLIDSEICEQNFNIKIFFKPWLSSSCSNIIIDFFSQLSNELSVYIPQIKSKLANYADVVSDFNQNSLVKSGIKLLKPGLPDSANIRYEDIKRILDKTKIKVLVFIDDTDRLSPEEIIEVFKLVRNTANFPYLQFIVTYDRNFIVNSLESLSINNPDKYLEKIFNLEVTLPKFDHKLTRIALAEELAFNLKIDEKYINTIKTYLLSDEEDYPIERILKSKRDIIRFTNSLIVNIEAISESLENNSLDDIEIVDFVYIELLRYKDPDFYNKLAVDPLWQLEISGDSYRYKKQDESITDKQNNIGIIQDSSEVDSEDLFSNREEMYYNIKSRYLKEEEVIAACMENLFPKGGNGDINSISKLRSFDQYFMYRFDEKNITTTETIRLLLEKNTEKQLSQIEEYYLNKKEKEVFSMVDYIVSKFYDESWNEDTESPYYYKNILNLIHTVLESKNDKLIEEVVNACSSIFRQSVYRDLDYYLEILRLWDRILAMDMLIDRNILMGLLYKDNLQSKIRRELTNDDSQKIEKFLRESVSLVRISDFINDYVDPENNVPGLVLSKSILKDIQLSYFLKYAERGKVNKDCITLFRNCADIAPKTRDYLWNKTASSILRELVDKDPQGYMSIYIVMDNFYIYSPCFWKPIFDDNAQEMEKYLFADDKNTLKGIEDARTVWKLYKYNDYKDVQINNLQWENMNQDILIPHLGGLLNETLEIKDKLEAMKGSFKTDQLIVLKDKLESSELYLALNGKLIKEIDNLLANYFSISSKK